MVKDAYLGLNKDVFTGEKAEKELEDICLDTNFLLGKPASTRGTRSRSRPLPDGPICL